MAKSVATLSQDLVVSSTLADADTAQAVAKYLQLPFCSKIKPTDYVLIELARGWAIKLPYNAKPWFVDWQCYIDRSHHGKHLLWRACGFKQPNRLTVIDATAGWGCDACMLAMRAKQVVMIEQHKVIHWLLADSMQRLSEPFMERVRLVHADANVWLSTYKEPVDVIYLDPMYPERNKRALSHKGMQVAQFLVNSATDSFSLLNTALQVARYRVVVKRPIWAGALADNKPDFIYRGSRCRYDVYQVN